jgi:putative DNA primase/helicase
MTITFLPPQLGDIELPDSALPDPRLAGKLKLVRLTGATDDAARREQTILLVQCAANIKPEKVDWLWSGRLARGKHTCIAGEPGTGKSQLSIAIIAAITTGGNWPCGEGKAPCSNVVILSAEDGAADTIVPRLLGAGADRTRVHIVSAVREADGSQRAPDLQRDIEALERKVLEVGNVALVVIDPISAYMGRGLDTHRNSDVRGVLAPLAEMAERTGTAVLSITHFSKSANASNKALHRFIGSIAFTAAARFAFAVIEDAEQEGRRLFLPVKNNLARPPQGLAYRLAQRFVGDGGDILTSHIVWDAEPVTITANEAMAADMAGAETGTAKAEAMDWLRELLADGPLAMSAIEDHAKGAGLAWATVRRAKKALRVTSVKSGMAGGWHWELSKALTPAEDAQV